MKEKYVAVIALLAVLSGYFTGHYITGQQIVELDETYSEDLNKLQSLLDSTVEENKVEVEKYARDIHHLELQLKASTQIRNDLQEQTDSALGVLRELKSTHYEVLDERNHYETMHWFYKYAYYARYVKVKNNVGEWINETRIAIVLNGNIRIRVDYLGEVPRVKVSSASGFVNPECNSYLQENFKSITIDVKLIPDVYIIEIESAPWTVTTIWELQ